MTGHHYTILLTAAQENRTWNIRKGLRRSQIENRRDFKKHKEQKRKYQKTFKNRKWWTPIAVQIQRLRQNLDISVMGLLP